MTSEPILDRAADVMITPDVLAAVPGLTFRRLDYWTSIGWIHADVAHPGSGVNRGWLRQEVQVLARMFVLVDAGIAPAVASGVARSLVVDGVTEVEIAPGLTIRSSVDPEPPAEAEWCEEHQQPHRVRFEIKKFGGGVIRVDEFCEPDRDERKEIDHGDH